MSYGPNIPPIGMGVPHGPIPDILFPRTPAYVTPNSRVEGEVKDGVRDQIARTKGVRVYTDGSGYVISKDVSRVL
jgi:hypothetical protein